MKEVATHPDLWTAIQPLIYSIICVSLMWVVVIYWAAKRTKDLSRAKDPECGNNHFYPGGRFNEEIDLLLDLDDHELKIS